MPLQCLLASPVLRLAKHNSRLGSCGQDQLDIIYKDGGLWSLRRGSR